MEANSVQPICIGCCVANGTGGWAPVAHVPTCPARIDITEPNQKKEETDNDND